MKRFVRWLPLLVVCLLSYFAVRPLFAPGLFPMHDNQQVARLYELDKSLSFGQFPVRWVSGLGFGFGYPLFNFYPPLAYYVGEAAHLGLRLNFIDSTKFIWFVALVGSGVAMFFLGRKLFGSLPGVVGATLYLYFPYHAVDAYVRGALAELFSFVWLPLILLFSYRTNFDGGRVNIIWTGVFLGLLMITHNLIFLPFFGFFAIWHFFLAILNRQRLSKSILSFMFSTLIAFGLTSFFWLPAIVERNFTLVDSLLIKSLALYEIHFVCPNQLWDSAWGYGGSVSGCFDGMSFKIGKIHLFISLLGVIAGLYLFLRSEVKKSHVILLSSVLIILSIFMTLPYSQIVWKQIPQLWYLQFPWRFLEFVGLFIAIVGAGASLLFRQRVAQFAFVCLVVFLTVFVNAKYFTPQKHLTLVNDVTYTTDQEIKWVVSNTSFEFLPKGIATVVRPNGTLGVDIKEEEIARRAYELSENVQVLEEKIGAGKFLLKVHSSGISKIKFNIVNFPGWKIWQDDTELRIDDRNKFKLMTVDISDGNHTVFGKFTDTPVRSLGNTISVVFVALVVLTLWKFGFSEFRHEHRRDSK